MGERSVARPVRAAIRGWVSRTFPADPSHRAAYDAPAGDVGWFGPASVTWRIHADFPAMLAGGLCALHLQALHPRALAGVWDHSDFRRDLLGRLRRTTAFVAGTTYASTASAQALADRVRRIHQRVRGVDAEGRAYAADEPALLRWVHVTEMASFLAGYRRYGPMPVDRGIADAYYAETARIAEALGASDLPTSEAAVEAYLDDVRAELRVDERSMAVLDALEHVALPVPLGGLARDLFLGAGTALLPHWAQAMLLRTPSARGRAAAGALALERLAPTIREAIDDGIAVRAMRRCGLPPQGLHSWPEVAPIADAATAVHRDRPR